MEMRAARIIGACGILALGALGSVGCGKVSKDNSPVLASVGGEKITQQAFEQTVNLWTGDPAKAKDILTNPAMKDQRNQILGSLANQKALLQMVKVEKLDQDPKVRLQVEAAQADAYFQILADRMLDKAEPTDAQLKTFYDELLIQAKAANQAQGLPPYEQVKAQLPGAYKRKQAQAAREKLMGEMNQKVPVVFSPDYKPAGMP
jgi:hypothetical protein